MMWNCYLPSNENNPTYNIWGKLRIKVPISDDYRGLNRPLATTVSILN
jgi:hypothetical protein